MRIVLAQFGAGRDKAENLRRMLELTAQAAERGGELVLFPECAMVSLPAGQSLAADAEPLDGPFNQALAAAAAQSRIAVVAGLYESIAAIRSRIPARPAPSGCRPARPGPRTPRSQARRRLAPP